MRKKYSFVDMFFELCCLVEEKVVYEKVSELNENVDIFVLLYELQVYKVELEMQNEVLCESFY